MSDDYTSHKEILDKLDEEHDTLLCTREQKNHIVSGMLNRMEQHPTRKRITKIYGVNVEIHEWIERPTLCKKSDVLPTAGYYQSGERQPKVI
jgi:hypothetical protein